MVLEDAPPAGYGKADWSEAPQREAVWFWSRDRSPADIAKLYQVAILATKAKQTVSLKDRGIRFDGFSCIDSAMLPCILIDIAG